MNIRKRFAFCATLFFCAAVNAQSANPFIEAPRISGDFKVASIGYDVEHNASPTTVEPDLVLKMTKISKAAFANFYKNYKPSLIRDSSKIIYGKKTFTLKTIQPATKKKAFDRQYSGADFIPSLNLYVANTVVPYEEVSITEFIDYRTGKFFEFPCGDTGPADILLSPKQGTLLLYGNADYDEGDCYIDLITIKRKPNGGRYTLQANLTINLDRINIQKLVWINESSFVMEVTERDVVEYNDDHNYGKKRKYFYKVNLIR